MIVLNKTDTAQPQQIAAARSIIAALNPDADIVETSMGQVDLDRVLDTGLFDHEKAQQHPLWFKELNGFAAHRPESERYGVASFVYRARRPFHPGQFHRFVNDPWPGVIRAKGHFWLATRPEWVGLLSQAGALVRHEATGFWWAAAPKNRWPDDPAWRQQIAAGWDAVYGDRRQEIIFIGTGMDEPGLRRRLDACLVGDANAKGMQPAA